MKQMAARRFDRAESSSPLRVIGIVDEGQYIASSSAGYTSGLQLLKEAVQNHGSSSTMTAAHAVAVAQISALALQLPCLQVLELTHHPKAVVEGVKNALTSPPSGDASLWHLDMESALCWSADLPAQAKMPCLSL